MGKQKSSGKQYPAIFTTYINDWTNWFYLKIQLKYFANNKLWKHTKVNQTFVRWKRFLFSVPSSVKSQGPMSFMADVWQWDINEKRHNSPLEDNSRTEKASSLLYINYILSKCVWVCFNINKCLYLFNQSSKIKIKMYVVIPITEYVKKFNLYLACCVLHLEIMSMSVNVFWRVFFIITALQYIIT